ncbi:hypothetical protein, partial [Aliivibrio fischeri]
TVDPISGGVINSSDITNVVVSGDSSRFDNSQKVTLVLSNNVDAQTKTTEATIQGDGSWSMAGQDLTGWPDSVVTATIRGSNQHGIAAKEVTETTQLSTARSTLTSVASFISGDNLIQFFSNSVDRTAYVYRDDWLTRKAA